MNLANTALEQDLRTIIQRSMLMGERRERRKHFTRYVFMLIAGVVFGVLVSAFGVPL